MPADVRPRTGVGPGQPKLLDRVRHAIRVRHYSPRTEEAYLHWIRRYIFFHGVRHPVEMGGEEVGHFLSHLAVDRGLSASTQNQALNALVFLYQKVLGRDIGMIDGVVRAKRSERLPVVLTPDEVRRVFRHLEGVPLTICRLLYGSGMRLLEGLRTRVKDIDFERHEIVVRDGKGRRDRVTILPESLDAALRAHLCDVRQLHERDLRRGLGCAELPHALARKYRSVDREWGWQYAFPASSYYVHEQTGARHRHHVHESVIQRAMSQAVRMADLTKHAISARAFCECLAHVG